MSTIAELDERLNQAREAWHAAFDQGKLDLVDAAYATLDALLEERIRCPQQRSAEIPQLKALAPKAL